MSFVTFEDFQLRYENALPAADEERVAVLLEDACDLAADIIGRSYPETSGNEVPSIIIAKVCEAVRRAYENPSGLQGETIGDYTWRGSSVGVGAALGIYFTPAESRIMRRAAGRSAAGSIDLETDLAQAVVNDELYLTDAGSPNEPILYFDQEDLL